MPRYGGGMSRQRRLRYSTLWNPAPILTEDMALARLRLSKGASRQEIKQAYKKYSLIHHPDRGGDQKLFIAVTEARDRLVELMDRREQPAQGRVPAESALDKERRAWGGGTRTSTVPWRALIRGLDMTAATAFLGLRADGRVDLFLQDTYKATYPAANAALYVVYEHVKSQTDVRQRAADIHFCILAREATKTARLFPLTRLAAAVGFRYEPGRPPNAPREEDYETATERDFE